MQFLPVQWFDSLPSTNTYLREAVEDASPPPSGTVVAARKQTAGRGRFERQWIGEPGRDLTFSFLIETKAPRTRLPSLAMAAALGVADALEALGLRAVLKWPNDVLVGGRKICGILAETVVRPNAHSRTVIVGIGLNVNMGAEAAARIPKPATSLRIETGRTTAIESLLKGLLVCLATRIETWETGGFSALRDDWMQRGLRAGTPLRVEDHGRLVEGVLAGYGANGELRLRDSGGKIHAIGAGDATVRGKT